MYKVCCTNPNCDLRAPEARRVMFEPINMPRAWTKVEGEDDMILRDATPTRVVRYLHMHQYDDAGTPLLSRGCAMIPEGETYG